MNKKYIPVCILAILTFAVGSAQAQTEISEEAAPETAQGINREAAQAERAEEQTERRAALDERASERITNLAANVSNKMDAAASRLQNIIDRLNSRIDKLAIAGINVSEARAALLSAQLSVTTAVNTLATIDAVVLAAITSEDPRASWPTVRATFENIRTELTVARTEIRAAIEALQSAARATEAARAGAATATAPVVSDTEETAAEEPVFIQ